MKSWIVAAALAVGLVGVPHRAEAMNSEGLLDAMASNSGLSKADAKRTLDGFMNAVSSTLKKGDRISLVGFGSFSSSKRAARTVNADGKVVVVQYTDVQFEAEGDDWEVAGACGGEVGADGLAKLMVEDITRGRPGAITVDQARDFIDTFAAVVGDALADDEPVFAGGFGVFYAALEVPLGVRQQRASGRNPQTGKEIKIAAKNVVRFKAGSELSEKVN